MEDPYSILGVPKDADEDTIKKAYRRLALQHHPDKGGNVEKFQQISEAFERIVRGDGEGDSPHIDVFHYDFLSEMFSFLREASMKGPPVHTTVRLTLRELYNGCRKDVQYVVHKPTGTFTVQQMGPLMVQQLQHTTTAETAKGLLFPKRSLPGKIIFEGKALHSHKEEGDLIVTVETEPDDTYFIMDDGGLGTVVEISLKEALCGFQRRLRFLDGKTIDINCKDSVVGPHTVTTLQGHGLREGTSLQMRYNVKFPERLSEESREALAKIL